MSSTSARTWTVRTFAQLISDGVLEIGDGYRAKNCELGGSGPIFLRAGHLTEAGIDFAGVERFRSEYACRTAGKTSQPGDVMVTTKGNSTGRTGYVSEDTESFVYSPHLSYWRSKHTSVLVPRFLRYWSKGSEFRSQLGGMAGSTDMAPYLSLTDQRLLRITLPPPAEQQAIAHVLGSLDEKIELNQRMNETLEATARAIFRSWFVDFDPVRAKVEGRQPGGMDAATAALFPDEFEETEMGEVPKGWEIGAISDLCDLNPTQIGREYEPKTIEYVEISGVSRNRLLQTTTLEKANAPSRAKRLVRDGDTILSTVRPERRSYLYISQPPGNLVVSTGFAVLRPTVASDAFLYCLTTSDPFIEFLSRNADGAAYPAIRPARIADHTALLPPQPVMESYDRICKPLLEMIGANGRGCNTLGAVRDTLLPKLLSGDVRASGIAEPKAVSG